MESAAETTILLVDINKDRLDAVYDLGTRYAKEGSLALVDLP